MAKVDYVAKRVNGVCDTVAALCNFAHQRRFFTMEERERLRTMASDIIVTLDHERASDGPDD